MIIPTEAIRAMYSALATANRGNELGAAFEVVRDAIDMELIPNEVLADVVLGKTTLAGALRQSADVMAMVDHAADAVADMNAAANELDAAAGISV